MKSMPGANLPPDQEQQLADRSRKLESSVNELHRAGAELELLLSATTIPVILLDGFLRVLRQNSQTMEDFGFRKDSTGLLLAELETSLEYPGLMADAHKALARPEPLECEVRHRDGRWFRARWQSCEVREETSARLVLSLMDITAGRRTEQALADSREHLRLIIENARDFAIFTTDLERRIVSWNTGAERILGFSESEILGETADVIFTPEDRAAMVPEKEEQTAIREGRASDDRWHLRKDGSRFWASGSMMAMRNVSGEVVGLLKIFRDQTAARNSREALERSGHELLAAARESEEARQAAVSATAAKDDFLAALSHELRTPLNPALMTIAALETDLSIPEAARLRLTSARRNIEMEAGLIDDLLDITRVTRGMMNLNSAPCDLHDLLARAAEIVLSDPQRGSGVLELDCGAEEHWVNGEATRLQQILWNLLRNAFKFAEPGGTITVRTYNNTEERVILTVTDTGIGIPADSLERIFEPFEQASDNGRHQFGGLGLGLAISKALAELHGGTLRASSNGRGKGATFVLELPTNPAGQLLSDKAKPENTEHGPPLRLLLVEDHEASLKALVWLLEREGHTVFPAGSGKEALALAEREECDLVISDIGLPDISGLEVMRQIQRLHGWPGIALSGYGMPSDISASRAAGFSMHLIKPVKIALLREALQKFGKPGTNEWMAQWRNLNQKRRPGSSRK